ncbi:hypothetical protein B0H13DRAFT_2334898 [Mycena leptocephala]|nr:hypothetical protein B0H13DRAFT_2334898 [Mycena leptocephala]
MSPPRRARTPRRRRDSLSLSPGRSETYSAQSFEQEYESVQQDREEEVPEAGPSFSGQAPLGRTPDPIQQYSPHFYSREEAVTTILDWSVNVTPLVPPSPPASEDWLWGLLWLQKTYLVCKDPRTLTRMKIYAAYHEVEDVVEILTLAIRFGLQFGLYVKVDEVLEFRNRNVTHLDSQTLGAIYAPGYVDECLSYGLGEIAAYTKYLSILGVLLIRPNTMLSSMPEES